eukprot:g33366.t1
MKDLHLDVQGETNALIKAHGEALENIDHFQELDSVLSAKATIDEEIQHCLQGASTAFSHLRKKVFEDNNIRSDTKLMVDGDVVVAAFLYDSVTWTVNSTYLNVLEQNHQCCLHNILPICCKERCTNTSDLSQANIPGIEASLRDPIVSL